MDFTLRRAVMQDCQAIFALSNQESVRKNSIRQDKITWQEHQTWFAQAIEHPCFFVAENHDGNIIAQVRFRQDGMISISIDEAFQGKKLGRAILKAAMMQANLPQWIALVRVDNLASVRLFLGLGFEEVSPSNAAGFRKFVFKSTS